MGYLTRVCALLLAVLLLLARAAASQTTGTTPPSPTSATLSTTTCPGAGCVVVPTSGYASVSVQITGTWVGTLTFQASDDNVNYRPLPMSPIGGGSATSTTTGNDLFVASSAGIRFVQVVFTAYTSGSASVVGQTAFAGGGTGSGGGGSSDVTIHDPSITTQKVAVNASGQMSITCANCSGSGASAVDESTFTQGTNSVAPAGLLYKTNYTALTSGQVGILRGHADGSLFAVGNIADAVADSGPPVKIGALFETTPPTYTTGQRTTLHTNNRGDLFVTAGTLGLTVTANQGGAPWSDNVTQFGGTNVSTGTGTGGAGIPRVTVSSDSSVTANAGTNLNTSALALDATVGLTQGSTTSGEKGPLAQGAVTTNAPTYTTAQTDPLSLDTAGLLRISLKDTPQNTTAFKVDGSAVTQTVTGNKTNNNAAPGATNVGVLPALANTSAPSYADGNQVLLSTDVSGGLRVNCVTGCGGGTGGTAMADRAAFTYGTTQFTPIGGVYNSSITALTSGQAGAAALTPARKTHVALFDANDAALLTTAGSLNVHVDNGTANATEAASYTTGIASVAQTIDFLQVYNAGGSGTWGRLTAGQALRNASLPVTMASDQTPIPVSHQLLNGWPVAVGIGPSTVATQRVALSQDSSVMIRPGSPPLATKIVDQYGNQIVSFGGGTQYTNNTTQATPIGTLALGYDGANVQALSTNASGHQNVIFPSAQAVTQSAGPWTSNVTQFGSNNVATGTGAGGVGIPRVTISNDSSLAANQSVNTAQFGGTNVVTGTGAGGAGIPRVTLSNDSSLAANQSVNTAQFGGNNVVTGTGTGGVGIPRVTVSSDSSITANAGTNLNTSALLLDTTYTGRTPAGASPADGESNTITTLSRRGDFAFVFNGTTWDRLRGDTTNGAFVNVKTSVLPTGASTEGTLASIKTDVDPFVASAAGGYVRQDSTATIAKETGGNLATVKTNTDPLVASGAGGYVRQDSTATIAKETGGNLATVKTNTDPFVAAGGGGYVRQDSTASIAKETGGNLAQIVTDLAATQPASNDTVLMAILRALVQQGTPKTAMAVRGSFGRMVSSTGDALDVNLKYPGAANDPCTGLRKASVPINQTAGAQLVTGMPGQRVYVCAVDVVTATAQNIALVEGLGTTCGSSTAGMAGGTTAATGWNFAANGGIALGNGGASVSIAATNGNNVCLLQSGAGQVSGNLVFAIQ